MPIIQAVAALVFVACLIGILAYAMFKGISASSQGIARFLAALCAGIAAFLIPGSALFQLNQTMSSGGTLIINGTAGVALFLIVFLFWGKIPQASPVTGSTTHLTFPSGITFKAAALQLAQLDNCVVNLQNFTQAEESAVLTQNLSLSTPVDKALKSLRGGVWSGPIHDYIVHLNGATYELS